METKLYCPVCSEYLSAGNNRYYDCRCGWKQPRNPNEVLVTLFEAIETVHKLSALVGVEQNGGDTNTKIDVDGGNDGRNITIHGKRD